MGTGDRCRNWASVAFLARCSRRFAERFYEDVAEPLSARAAVMDATIIAECRAAMGGKIDDFEQVIETALTTKKVLDDIGVTGYVKTSGSTGIHIYIPLGAKYTYDECQLFGKLIATEVHRLVSGV